MNKHTIRSAFSRMRRLAHKVIHRRWGREYSYQTLSEGSDCSAMLSGTDLSIQARDQSLSLIWLRIC